MIRRIEHPLLSPKAADARIAYQDLESKQLLIGLLDSPDLFREHNSRYTASVITQITYGWRTPTSDDIRVKVLFDDIGRLTDVVGSASAVLMDIYPALFRLLPDFMVPMRRFGKRHHEKEKAMYMEYLMNAKNAAKAGTLKVSLQRDTVTAALLTSTCSRVSPPT
jgi:hypothetical protein